MRIHDIVMDVYVHLNSRKKYRRHLLNSYLVYGRLRSQTEIRAASNKVYFPRDEVVGTPIHASLLHLMDD